MADKNDWCRFIWINHWCFERDTKTVDKFVKWARNFFFLCNILCNFLWRCLNYIRNLVYLGQLSLIDSWWTRRLQESQLSFLLSIERNIHFHIAVLGKVSSWFLDLSDKGFFRHSLSVTFRIRQLRANHYHFLTRNEIESSFWSESISCRILRSSKVEIPVLGLPCLQIYSWRVQNSHF